MKKRNGRVKEEPDTDFEQRSKGRTSNVQRPTSNVQLGERKRHGYEREAV